MTQTTKQAKYSENKANIFKKNFFSIYSLASDLLVSLIRKKLIKYYDKSNAKSLRSVAPGRYSLGFMYRKIDVYLPQVCPFVGVLGHDASAPLENPSISTHPSIACPSISDGHNQVSGEKG